MSVAWFATKGSGTNEARRMAELLQNVEPRRELAFNKSAKLDSLAGLWRSLRAERPELLVMEGTGIAGGLVCLAARIFLGVPYVVSSGDAVGPFIRARHPVTGIGFEIYERALCRLSAGFIGWTPYLVGRAMAFGARKAMTAPGWVIGGEARGELAKPPPWTGENAIVVGIVGSLEWNPRKQWCYGMDLVRAICRTGRPDLRVVVAGGGSGLDHLRRAAGDELGRRVFLPGPIPLDEVVGVMKSFHVASLPQSVDGVGSYRYTTKLPEYAAAGLPVITNEIPMAYDLGCGWTWRLPGRAPWAPDYLDALARCLEKLDAAEIQNKRARIPDLQSTFDRDAQIARVTEFIADIRRDLREAGHAS